MVDKKSNTVYLRTNHFSSSDTFRTDRTTYPNREIQFSVPPWNTKGTVNIIILYNVEFRPKCYNGLEKFYSI